MGKLRRAHLSIRQWHPMVGTLLRLPTPLRMVARPHRLGEFAWETQPPVSPVKLSFKVWGPNSEQMFQGRNYLFRLPPSRGKVGMGVRRAESRSNRANDKS